MRLYADLGHFHVLHAQRKSALHAYPRSAEVGRVTLLASTRVAFYTSSAMSNKTIDRPRDHLHRLLLVHALR